MAKKRRKEKYEVIPNPADPTKPVFRYLRNKNMEKMLRDPALADFSEHQGYRKDNTGIWFYGELIIPNPRKKPTAKAAAELVAAKPKPVLPASEPKIDLALVEKHLSNIVTAWQKEVGSILEVAAACKDAQLELVGVDLAEVKKRSPFGSATFSKLARIGETSVFYKDEVKAQLPSKFSVLYELSGIENTAALQDAIKEGVIHPRMTRDEVTTLKIIISGTSGSTKSSHDLRLPPGCYAVVKNKEDAPPQLMKQLHLWLDKGRSLKAVKALLTRPEVDRRRRDKKILAEVRRAARKLVSEAIPVEFSEKERKNPVLKITNHASFDDIQKVLTAVRRDPWYPFLFKAAESKVDAEVNKAVAVLAESKLDADVNTARPIATSANRHKAARKTHRPSKKATKARAEKRAA